ncbi:DUF2911 domain-containing protein [Aquirufa sp. KTFRIE-69F]|uniref:DUF2911 domain-containing protein n=1 Tax=Aquirufa originis TaxID=3096514 RepID=A0ABW6DB21_9BACT
MKKFLLLLSCLVSFGVLAQKAAPSPAAVASQKVGNTEVMIKYAQPSVKGRLVFGTKEAKALVPYGEVWRTGANEATTIEISNDITVQGKTLAKGVYSLLSIPGETEWTIIFNKEAKMWGAYTYKEANDVLRVKARVSEHAHTEQFAIGITAAGQVTLDWDKSSVSFYLK